MLAKSFVSDIIIDLSYNFNKYTQYKHFWKLFEVGCLHQHTVIALYREDRIEKLLKILQPCNLRTGTESLKPCA